jgi:hypothetical protein
MLELTTSVVFLMSSVYGNQNINNSAIASTATASAASTASEQASSTDPVAFIGDRAGMQAYLAKEFKDEPILVDVARCESNFAQFDKNGDIVRGIVNHDDVGVMQINEKIHGAMAVKLGFDLHTVEGNIGYAKHLYEEQGAQPWTFSSKCWAGDELAKK